MNPRIISSIACALLLVIIAAEWLLPNGTGAGPGSVPAAGQGGSRTGTPITSLGATALAAKILDRPLFLVGRHIPPSPVNVAAPVQKAIVVPRLTGVLLMSGARIAVFEVAGQLKPISASVGDRVTDWTVTAITADSATLSGAGGVRVLNPAPDPNDTTDPPDAAGGDAGDPPSGPDQ